MVPVAAVGIQQVVEKVTESSSAPIEVVDTILPPKLRPKKKPRGESHSNACNF